MKEKLDEQTMALRAVKEFRDGDYVNLGAGIPLLCAALVPSDKHVILHAEQGVFGYGELLTERDWRDADFDYVDAGFRFFRTKPGLCFMDMDLSFDLIRGVHLDMTVLGGLEVSEKGDFANWSLGDVKRSSIGGAMDLAVGAKRVIVVMKHVTNDGRPRVVKECHYPLTAKECVNLLITDLAVIEVTKEGLLLREVAPGWTPHEVQSMTEPKLIIDRNVAEIEL